MPSAEIEPTPVTTTRTAWSPFELFKCEVKSAATDVVVPGHHPPTLQYAPQRRDQVRPQEMTYVRTRARRVARRVSVIKMLPIRPAELERVLGQRFCSKSRCLSASDRSRFTDCTRRGLAIDVSGTGDDAHLHLLSLLPQLLNATLFGDAHPEHTAINCGLETVRFIEAPLLDVPIRGWFTLLRVSRSGPVIFADWQTEFESIESGNVCSTLTYRVKYTV